METLSLQGAPRSFKPSPAPNRTLSTPSRLANVVRRDGQRATISVDSAPDLETAAQRPRRAEPFRRQPLSPKTATLHPRRSLSLCFRAARQSGRQLVDPPATRPLAASVIRRRPATAGSLTRGGMSSLRFESAFVLLAMRVEPATRRSVGPHQSSGIIRKLG